ncbi:MAG: hypothetical protein B5M52_06135 [Helicobacteraceae bacterium 4484_230]|nr:MAG: hypothetical protein B5M52_06135 [Helicobacteraceae bacterium 4484_230]
MKRRISLAGVLLAALLVHGCSKGSNEKDTQGSASSSGNKKIMESSSISSSSISSQNSNAAAAATLHSLELSIPVSELSENNETTITLQGIYSDGKKKQLSENITWQISDTNVLEVKGMKLIAKIEGSTTLRAEVNGKLSPPITITVYKVIHGHRLPPEPDPKINNSTLLGIDSNNNGVRDDVERWIYMTYNHPIERGLFMQSARAYQKVIVDPGRAHETTKYINDSVSCELFWKYKETNHPITKYRDIEGEISQIQFNTINRYIAYKKYNAEFNGEVFGVPPASKDKCEFNENGIFKELY